MVNLDSVVFGNSTMVGHLPGTLPLPRTWVNEGKKKGRRSYAPAPLMRDSPASCRRPGTDRDRGARRRGRVDALLGELHVHELRGLHRGDTAAYVLVQ